MLVTMDQNRPLLRNACPNPIRAFVAGTRIFCTCVANYLRTLGPECDVALSAKHQHLVKRALRFNQALADSLDDQADSRMIDALLVNAHLFIL